MSNPHAEANEALMQSTGQDTGTVSLGPEIHNVASNTQMRSAARASF